MFVIKEELIMARMIFDSRLAEETAVSLFVPVAAFNRRPAFPWKGEHALAAAVLNDAITQYRRHRYAASKKGRNIFQREEKWIFFGDTFWPFSFVNICNLLELAPSAVRAQLLSETKEEMKEFLKQTQHGISKSRINARSRL